jgi:hypothetical protein
MSSEKAKQKAALVVAGAFALLIFVPVLLVVLRDYLYAAIFIACSIISISIAVWGMWDQIWQEIHARDKMIEDLYARCHSEDHRRFTKFYIEYFKL